MIFKNLESRIAEINRFFLVLHLFIIKRSPLPQGRGLKQLSNYLTWKKTIVAPPAGAWIETAGTAYAVYLDRSPLPQGRGLKPQLLAVSWLP